MTKRDAIELLEARRVHIEKPGMLLLGSQSRVDPRWMAWRKASTREAALIAAVLVEHPDLPRPTQPHRPVPE